MSHPYLALLKRTSNGTLAYWLLGVKIVNLKGMRPSVLQMTFRWLILIFGPIHFLIDVLWVTSDENKQTLRDKIVGTYVVRNHAVPIGRGEQILVKYFLLAFAFEFREVKRTLPEPNQAL
jgi:uncharacterized RDD family membrane protein YckC